jgi:acetylornithine deacetylase
MSGTPRSQSLLRDLVGFDTTSRNPNRPLIEYVRDYLKQFGVEAELIWNNEGTKANLWATIGPADRPGIILSGHTDVVPVDDQDWSSEPFSLRQADGRLYGRGTADMKGFIAAVLAMVPAMLSEPLVRPFHMALSYDEEIGCTGVTSLIERIRSRSVPAEMCLVGEPTEMLPVVGHKGGRAYKATVTGKEAHSSLAPRAVNAVEYAAELIAYLTGIAKDMADRGPRDEAYDVVHGTLQTCLVHGGTAVNVVPGRCEFAFEFRHLAETDPESIMSKVKEFVENRLQPRMHAVEADTGIMFEPIYSYPALATPRDAAAVQFVKQLVNRNDDGKVAFGTEGGLFSNIGIPTVVCGPGSIVQAHKPDEYIAIEQLSLCEAFLERLIASAR